MKAYENGQFSEAEVQFRKAGDISNESYEADFNTGAALYNQQKYEETMKQYESLVDRAGDTESMAHVWHNIGNSLLESQQFAPSIEAYKNSLRLNPRDLDTKYNLAYAKKKLQEQEQQQQDQQNQDQDQEGEENQQDKEQDDQQDQEQDNQQDQEQDDQQDQEQDDQQDQDQEQQENQQDQSQDQQEQEQQQPKPQEISKEDAERMLNAIQQQEKDVKEKVDKKKAAVAKVKTAKDW